MSTFQDITFTTGTSSGGSPNNLPVTMPATVAANDRLLMGVWNANLTPPTGWTLVDSSNNVSDRLRLYTKVAAGTEGGTTVNCTERAGTVAGLNFLACVVRYKLSAAAIAQPYAISYSGGQFGSAGMNPYTEIYVTGNLGATWTTGCFIKYLKDGVVGGASPDVTSTTASINNRGSVDHLTSSTASNSATQHGRLIVVDYDDVTGDFTGNDQTATYTSPGSDILLNGTGAFMSTTGIPLGDPSTPSSLGGFGEARPEPRPKSVWERVPNIVPGMVTWPRV